MSRNADMSIAFPVRVCSCHAHVMSALPQRMALRFESVMPRRPMGTAGRRWRQTDPNDGNPRLHAGNRYFVERIAASVPVAVA